MRAADHRAMAHAIIYHARNALIAMRVKCAQRGGLQRMFRRLDLHILLDDSQQSTANDESGLEPDQVKRLRFQLTVVNRSPTVVEGARVWIVLRVARVWTDVEALRSAEKLHLLQDDVVLCRLVENHVYGARLIVAYKRRESLIVISGLAVHLDAHVEGVGRRLDFEFTLDVRALSGHAVDIRVKVPDKLRDLFAVLTHVSNGLLARGTVQLFVPIHLLRKRTEEAVAATAHVHCLPTVGFESSEATTQLGVVDGRRCLLWGRVRARKRGRSGNAAAWLTTAEDLWTFGRRSACGCGIEGDGPRIDGRPSRRPGTIRAPTLGAEQGAIT